MSRQNQIVVSQFRGSLPTLEGISNVRILERNVLAVFVDSEDRASQIPNTFTTLYQPEPRQPGELADPPFSITKEVVVRVMGDFNLDDSEVLPVVRLDKESLRQFVLDYVDNNILIDQQVPDHLLGSVFMPIFFGALTPKNTPDYSAPEEPERPLQPFSPDKTPWEPLPPNLPVYPKAPVFSWTPPSREATKFSDGWAYEEEQESTHQVEVSRSKEEAEEKHLVVMGKHDELVASIDAKSQVDQDDYRRNHEAWERGEIDDPYYQEQMQTYQEDLETYQPRLATWGPDHEAWQSLKDIADEKRLQFMQAFTKDLGVIWEYHSEAGPRAINGYPIFMSLHMLHRKDWNIAGRAITREIERREALDMDLEDIEEEEVASI